MLRLFASLIATFSYKRILSLCLVLSLILSSFPFARSVYALTFQLSGKVSNESSTPIEGSIIDVFNTGTSTVIASDTTDINGDYSIAVSDGIYDIQVTPLAGSGFQIATVTNIEVSSDTVLNFTLVPVVIPSPFTVSGTVTDRSENVVGGIEVELGYNSTRLIGTTDSNGFYSIQVPSNAQTQNGFDGQVALRANNPNSQYLPRTLRLLTQDSLHFTQDTTLDIQIPGNLLTVHVQDPSQNPVVDARVDIFPVNDGSPFPVQTSLGIIQFAPNDNLHPGGGTAFSLDYTNNTGSVTQAYFPVDINLKVVPPDLNIYQLFETQLFLNSDINQIIAFQFVHDPPITTALLTPSTYSFGEYHDPTTVTLSAAAYTGFTIDLTYYQVDGGSTQTYLDPFEVIGNGEHTITFWSVDNLGVFEAPKTETFTIHTNLAPAANAGEQYTVDEGGEVLVSATGSDPEEGQLTYEWDLDNNGSFETPGQSVNFSAATLDGPSNYTIAVQVTDDGNLSATDQATVNVVNVVPIIGVISAPVDPVLITSMVTTSASFSDAGIPDTHTAEWNWGDTSTTFGTVDQLNDMVTGSHTYTTPGVYEIILTVTDDDLESGESIYQFVVVYDSSSSGGFVTGAGTIVSPAGAYTANSSLTGIANFGFVSRYQPGASIPTGDTQFRFQVAQFRFSSNDYDWLVVAGPQAKYKGTGTVNGSGNYGFQLSATDGTINGGGGVDKFRIKIWDKDNNDEVVYDNELGSENNDNPTTAIQGGNIVIH